jgi:hypothetical protein
MKQEKKEAERQQICATIVVRRGTGGVFAHRFRVSDVVEGDIYPMIATQTTQMSRR